MVRATSSHSSTETPERTKLHRRQSAAHSILLSYYIPKSQRLHHRRNCADNTLISRTPRKRYNRTKLLSTRTCQRLLCDSSRDGRGVQPCTATYTSGTGILAWPRSNLKSSNHCTALRYTKCQLLSICTEQHCGKLTACDIDGAS